MSEDTKKEVERLRGLLTDYEQDLIDPTKKRAVPSKLTLTYNQYLSTYNNALMDYNSLIIGAAGGDKEAVQTLKYNGAMKKGAVDAAYGSWVSVGYKNDYEAVVARIANLVPLGPAAMWLDYKNQMGSPLSAGAEGGLFYPTSWFPPNFWNASWTKLGWSSSEEHSFDETTTKQYGGGGGWGFSLFGWSGGGSSSHTETSTVSRGSLEASTCSFELVSVPLIRPWFAAEVLKSRKWKWNSGTSGSRPVSGMDLLSDGKFPSPNGTCPAYCTDMILARSLKINTKSTTRNFKDEYSKSQSEGRTGISFGPFHLGGASASNLDERKSTWKDAIINETSIEAPDMQIIGYRIQILDKMPNPDF